MTQEVLKSQLAQLGLELEGNTTNDLLQGLENKYPGYKEIIRALPHLVNLLPAKIQPDTLIAKNPKASRLMFLLARRFVSKYDHRYVKRAIE